MSPILLKLKGSEESLPLFSNLDEQELSKTWRICTKVKDALENGSRLENLSWRLWFLQNVNDTNSKNKHESPAAISRPQETIVSLHCSSISSSTDVEDAKPNNFILNQFSSDQEGDQMIELRDIIQYPMENQHYTTTTTMYNDTIHQENDASLFEQPFAYYDNNLYNLTNLEGPSYVITNVSQPLTTDHNDDTVTYYHTEIPSMTIPVDTKHIYYNNVPNATLHNKLLATLPKQTLASAEKLLTPTTTTTTYPQQHQYYSTTTNTNTFDTTFQMNQMSQSYPTLNNIYLSNETNNISNESTEEDKPPICSNCGATSTPLWRRSDKKILCNACGLYLKLHNIPRPKHLKPLQGKLKTEEETQQHQTPTPPPTTCSNCGTSKTPLWRRDMEGAPLCNACGLYFKLHKEKRPLSMKTDTIKKRQRTEALLVNSTASGQLKKPKYLDHLSLYSFAARGKNASVATSLPGTGVLMMTPISNQ